MLKVLCLVVVGIFLLGSFSANSASAKYQPFTAEVALGGTSQSKPFIYKAQDHLTLPKL